MVRGRVKRPHHQAPKKDGYTCVCVVGCAGVRASVSRCQLLGVILFGHFAVLGHCTKMFLRGEVQTMCAVLLLRASVARTRQNTPWHQKLQALDRMKYYKERS